MYHDVPDSLFSYFKSHMAWLSQHFEFVRPDDLLRETRVSRRPKLLLTFDDGCVDNYELVAPLLESYDARGLFFVCPGFADLDREESFRLMERSAAALGESNRDSRWQRLTRAQIVELDKRGHGIGNHTLTHAPLARISEAEVIQEVKQSAELLASWLGHDCHFFAWTYSWDEITPHALKIALCHHRFCFSPCSGLNPWPQPPRLLARTGVDISKPLPYLQTQLSGLQELAYKSKRERLRRLWSSVNAA
jgi:peptidoglycan/xylan/chitin deacetylase (PgdA/CDA1 family)